ncbi:dynamin family protein [Paenibacillus phoenicis]|uniref:Dynamin family protein n=5 Tax=Paenibacillus TaxID=44249 RepID=A0ABU5PIM2_9BACL|nr:dynamin family protein [Paenibacillus phoenicis]MEA3569805.1 dynamin family protein [Paenibacillus phoenicis]
MDRTMTKTDYELQERLHQLQHLLEQEGDATAAAELREVGDKLGRRELVAAFCGHFSAGKSSLINALSGKTVMPASPLPTSANVVLIREGEPRALLTPADPAKPKVEVPVDEVVAYCRNGEEYARVELWDRVELPPRGGVLLDTPGVDSNDAGHAMATYSALHLADVVFYVMDYNHVSSETNLSFAKSLSDYGKPVYMIVNQIDKHREEELAFTAYQASVSQAFRNWNIKAQGIFYISLKKEDAPGNMLPQLRKVIRNLFARGEGLLEYSAYASAAQSVEGYLARAAAAEQSQREQLVAEAGGETDVTAMEEELRQLEMAGPSGEQVWDMRKQEWLRRISSLLETAQMMTPPLREQAGRYLESQAPGFKVKGWFAAGKTEAEKQKRQSEFLQALAEQVEAQLDWHVRQELRAIGQELEIWGEAWEQQLDERMPKPAEAWITEPLPGGAMLSGESTLHYAAAVAAGIAARYRRAAVDVIDALLAAPSPRRAAEAEAALARRAELAARLPAARALAQLDAAAEARAARCAALLGAPVPLTPGLLPEVRAEAAAPRAAGGAGAPAAAEAASTAASAAPPPQAMAAGGSAPAATAPAPAAAAQEPPAAPARGRALAAAARLAAAAERLAPHPAFGTGVRELTRRAAELRDGVFTVALFGAFSAGKSSFASALLGEAVLPVSPHPTTAAIIRVMAPAEGQRHNTAAVKFKSAEAIREDLAYSFQALGLGEWKETAWMEAVRRLKPEDIPAAGRAHYSFLQAAAAGWAESADRLGQVEVVEAEQFRSYAADEAKACFVAEIDFYYRCPLTEQGIVLVDTPGADSIHARHTGVTFQYMKDSDAIIFVTYYNHAFSRADKQLLSQLGRMKGSFALDKMFFVVNAADLASSEEELTAVVEHVRDGLRTAGIQQPNVYAVSSMRAMAARRDNTADDPGFSLFRQRFSTFLEQDLGNLAVSSAVEMMKQMQERLSKWTEAAGQSAENAEQQLAALRGRRDRFEQAVAEFLQVDIGREWSQENAELLFHVVQRVRLQALELFTEFFHPSLLQEHNGPLKRNFTVALRGWLDQVSGELERELLATTLRLERKAEALLRREAEGWCRRHEAALDMPLSYSNAETSWDTPAIPEGLLGSGSLAPETYWPYFKNPKAFFEGGGRLQLRAKLEEPLLAKLKAIVGEMEAFFREHYEHEIALRKEQTAETFRGLWAEWEQSIQGSKVSPEELARWKSILAQIGRDVEEMEAFYDK